MQEGAKRLATGMIGRLEARNKPNVFKIVSKASLDISFTDISYLNQAALGRTMRPGVRVDPRDVEAVSQHSP